MIQNTYKNVWRFCAEKGLIREGDSILTALSGGPDSVFLFHFLCWLSGKTRIQVSAAYVHHHLRQEADIELGFARRLALGAGVPFYYRNIKIEGSTGIEEKARILRYRALYAIAKRSGCGRIAAGHTLDDQAETVVMRFIKGTGLAGLRGILAEKRLVKSSEIRVIRPLLCLEKKEILRILGEEGLEYMVDRSNFSDDFFRNCIRSEVMPVLLKHNPRLKKQVARMSFLVQDDFSFIRDASEKAFVEIMDGGGKSVDAEAFRRLPVSVKRFAASMLVERITGSQYRSFNRIRQVIDCLEKRPRKRVAISDIEKSLNR